MYAVKKPGAPSKKAEPAAHNKHPSPLGPPKGPRYRPTVGSLAGTFSYERGTPVQVRGMYAVKKPGAPSKKAEPALLTYSSLVLI